MHIKKLMKQNIIKEKSFMFAVRIVNLCKILKQRNEFVLSRQLLRSATSVGANTREALNAESKKDFIHKLQIAQKEADESIYWLELLHATEYLNDKEFSSLNNDAVELSKILKSIILSTKNNS